MKISNVAPGPVRRLALALALAACAATAAATCSGPETPAHDEAKSQESPAGVRDRAHALLATDRPWQAARLLREYRAGVTELPPDVRLLAARAEAAWGAWAEVRALLEGADVSGEPDGALSIYLLARARDETGDAPGAVAAYREFLAGAPSDELATERSTARLRLGLALIRTGDRPAARLELAAVEPELGGASYWLELLEADALAAAADTAAVRSTAGGFRSGYTGLRAWRARVAAAENAGDLAGARALANQARAWARTKETKSEFFVAAARAAIGMGDNDAGRAALRAAIDLGAAGPHARAAASLLQSGPMSPADHLAVARVLRAQGLHEAAIPGYRAWLESGIGSTAERSAVHLEHATALFYAERYDQVDSALAPISGQAEARFLLARAASHRGDLDRAVAVYLALASEYAGTGNGVQALFLAASTRHDGGDLERARELYRQVVSRYPGRSQMGLATMRLAGITFLEGDYEEAASLWENYRSRYPRGSHWQEATYWSGRARAALGDTATAAARFRAVRQRDRESYYSLLASQRLGEDFWPLPMSPSPATPAAAARRVDGWMRGVDLLRSAGFEEEAAAEADRVADAAGSDRATLYALAEALAERGYTRRAIQIGLRLDAVEPRNERLLRILYPFPYRTLVISETSERGVDPFTAAALIRQESMFEARITSPAGARGLMQIMPATGEALAAAARIDPWDAETLYQPEINVHLGTRYLSEHLTSYGGSLPAVFSAYNAGPHRVQWWSAFPEYAQEELFTERIPYRETRDYVKILTLNRAVYRGLYGAELAD